MERVSVATDLTHNHPVKRSRHFAMAPFRAKRMDLGGFISTKIIRDHTKRKVFEKFEPERYALRTEDLTQNQPNSSCPEHLEPLSDDICLQTSFALHNPKYVPSATNASAGAASTHSDALLYATDTDQEQMYNGRGSKRSISRC